MKLEPINLQSTTQIMNLRVGQMFQVAAGKEVFKGDLREDDLGRLHFMNGETRIPLWQVDTLLYMNMLKVP